MLFYWVRRGRLVLLLQNAVVTGFSDLGVSYCSEVESVRGAAEPILLQENGRWGSGLPVREDYTMAAERRFVMQVNMCI